jgi:hypothetical protein
VIVKRHINGVSECCAAQCRVYRRVVYTGNHELLYQCLQCMGWTVIVKNGGDFFEVFLTIDCSKPLE